MLKTFSVTLLVVALAMIAANAVFAHEERDEGGYQFIVGFLNEPAYEGAQNGVSIRVSKAADDHSDEGDAHAHGGAMGGNMQMGGMEMDVNEHGGIFASPTLAKGDTFEYTASHMLEGMTIPFHNHLNHDMMGSIMVSETAHDMARVEIQIHGSTFEPAEVMVRPDTVVVFMNHSDDPQNITSGVAPGGDHAHEEAMVPVEGLQDTLQVEVTYVPTNTSKTMNLRTVFGDPGHYAADLIPTSPGHYRFRIVGTVEGNSIDATYDSMSGGGQFDDVQVASAIHFPETVASSRELESAVRGAQSTAEQAQDAAAEADDNVTSASTMGIIGIILGAIGIALGGGAALMSMRNRNNA